MPLVPSERADNNRVRKEDLYGSSRILHPALPRGHCRCRLTKAEPMSPPVTALGEKRAGNDGGKGRKNTLLSAQEPKGTAEYTRRKPPEPAAPAAAPMRRTPPKSTAPTAAAIKNQLPDFRKGFLLCQKRQGSHSRRRQRHLPAWHCPRQRPQQRRRHCRGRPGNAIFWAIPFESCTWARQPVLHRTEPGSARGQRHLCKLL